MRRSFLLALCLAGCGSAPPSTTLTTGSAVKIDGCPFTFTTPNETTAPLVDDGKLGPLPGPRAPHVSFVGDPGTSMSVVWETDFATTGSTLELGADAGYGTKVKGFSYAYPTDESGNDPPSVRVHQAHVCGLQPATTYHYRVGAGTQVTADATFTTAPADSSPRRILIVGDSREGPAIFQQVITAALADAPDLAVFTGDAVFFGYAQDQWDTWFASAQALLPRVPLLFVMGNHEDNQRHYYAQFAQPQSQQGWYSFDYGDLHFTVLNDSPLDRSTIAGAQARFLDQDLAATTKTWKLVVHHKPVYTSYVGAVGHPPEDELKANWVPLYEQHQVDLVFNGHVHGYERSFPLKGGQPVAMGQGPIYNTFGGAGAASHDLQPETFLAKQAHGYGYLLVDVAGHTLTVTAKSLDGTILDKYSITK